MRPMIRSLDGIKEYVELWRGLRLRVHVPNSWAPGT